MLLVTLYKLLEEIQEDVKKGLCDICNDSAWAETTNYDTAKWVIEKIPELKGETMKIRLFDIGWDVDGGSAKDFGLPKEVIIDNPGTELVEAAKATLQNNEAAEELEDYLSDNYGFCVYEFGVEVIQ